MTEYEYEYEYFHFSPTSCLCLSEYATGREKPTESKTHTKNENMNLILQLHILYYFSHFSVTHPYMCTDSFVRCWETINYEYIDSIDTFWREIGTASVILCHSFYRNGMIKRSAQRSSEREREMGECVYGERYREKMKCTQLDLKKKWTGFWSHMRSQKPVGRSRCSLIPSPVSSLTCALPSKMIHKFIAIANDFLCFPSVMQKCFFFPPFEEWICYTIFEIRIKSILFEKKNLVVN